MLATKFHTHTKQQAKFLLCLLPALTVVMRALELSETFLILRTELYMPKNAWSSCEVPAVLGRF